MYTSKVHPGIHVPSIMMRINSADSSGMMRRNSADSDMMRINSADDSWTRATSSEEVNKSKPKKQENTRRGTSPSSPALSTAARRTQEQHHWMRFPRSGDTSTPIYSRRLFAMTVHPVTLLLLHLMVPALGGGIWGLGWGEGEGGDAAVT